LKSAVTEVGGVRKMKNYDGVHIAGAKRQSNRIEPDWRLRRFALYHIAASRKLRRHSSSTVGAAGRPIANRPQVANLPRIAAGRKPAAIDLGGHGQVAAGRLPIGRRLPTGCQPA
jgi:hypothetical protein